MSYQILGGMVVGEDFSLTSILEKGVPALQEGATKVVSFTEERDRLKKVLAADEAWKSALGQALYTKSDSDQQAADVAKSQADALGQGLSPASAEKRVAEARKRVESAQKDYQEKAKAAASDPSKKEAAQSAIAYLRAAEQVAARAANAQLVTAAQTGTGMPSSSSYNMPGGAPSVSHTGLFIALGAGLLAVVGIVTVAFLKKG